MGIRVIIVEDDPEVRKLTASLINLYPDLECIGLFETAEAFEAALPDLLPDVVLIDLSLPGMSGCEIIRKVRPDYPDINFMMFTIHQHTREVFECLASGARGYVLKGAPPEDISFAIRELQKGYSYMSGPIARMVMESFRVTEKKYPYLEKLTTQERLVLESLAKGLRYKEIAAKHFVELTTIKSQVSSIFRKLEVHSRTEAVNKVYGKGGKS